MNFLLSLILASFLYFGFAAFFYEGIPPLRLILDSFVEEPFGAITVYLAFFVLSYVILRIPSSRRKKALQKELERLTTRPLPWHIENDNDLYALSMKFDGVPLAAKEYYQSLRPHIASGESLYFVTTLATCYVHRVTEPAGGAILGDIFLSDQRILYRDSTTEKMTSFPLRDIVSIALNDTAVAFCTEEINISFVAITTASTAQPIYDIFDRALTEAGVELSVAPAAAGGEPILPQTQTTAVDCPGCGAAVRVTIGQATQCDFCRRTVSASE